ncbi:MAG: hypothetical protein R2733_17390 [Acidimicrobiales bacterium]
MYQFEGRDWSQLVGGVLESVTFVSNAIDLDFGQWGVTCMNGLTLKIDGRVENLVVLPTSANSLPSLIGAAVESIAVTPKVLRLNLSDSAWIELVDDSVSYESYLFRTLDGEVVV